VARLARTHVVGLGLVGLCGCSLVLDLGQFDGATLGGGDDSGSLGEADSSSWNDESADGSSATNSDSAADATSDLTDAGTDDASDAAVNADAGTSDSAADAVDAATIDVAMEAAPNDGTTEAAPSDANAAPNDATGKIDGGDGELDASREVGGSDGADTGAPPVVSYTWDNASAGVMGWSAHGWNIGDGGAIGACVVSYVSTDGYPSPGCLSIAMPFTAANQVVGISAIPGIFNISGKIISFYMKFDPPMTTSTLVGGGGEYEINFSDVKWGWSTTQGIAIPATALAGTWTYVSTEVDFLPNLTNDAGGGGSNNPALAHQFGIWIQSVGAVGPFQTATLLIDDFVVR